MAKLTVSLSKDKMLAYVSGTIDESVSKKEIIQLIKEAVSEKKVEFGIQEKLIASVAIELFEQRRIEGAIVAIGEYPKQEKLAGARFLVPTYLENNLDYSFLENISKPVQYYQLLEYISEPYIVRENEPVGKFRTGEKGASGHNVLGETKDMQSKAQPPEDLGQGLITHYDSSDIISTLFGIIIRKKSQAYVLPVNLDGTVFVNVSKDKVKAYLHLFPPGPDGKEVTKQDILNVLERESIVYGINEDAVNKALAVMKETGNKVEGDLIAEGTPPVPGEDAKIEYQVDLSFSHKPKIKKDGRADYYSIHLFESVAEKQPIAKIVPPTDGTPGTDVFGNPIEAPPGKSTQISLGKNIETMSEDPMTLIAIKTGHVYLRGENLLVEEILNIETDVDFKTGNIDFIGDVLINGDVKSGFSVKAAGNINITGTVEDAIIEAGESVIVHSGFLGKGKGRIKAGGDVVVKHVRNQTIMAKNNILVDGEVLDSSLFAGNEMFVEVKKSWIVGGIAVARNKIRAYAIGNASHVPTEVASGIDLFVKKILEELEREIVELENEVNIIANNEKRLTLEEFSEGELKQERRTVSRQLKKLREEHEKKIKQLRKYKSHYRRSLYDTKGTVGVINTIYPGVTVKIGNRKTMVRDALKKCLFYIHEDTIKSRSFSL